MPCQPISLRTGLDPTSIIAAPLFGSGPLDDLAVADQAAGTVSLLQGNGLGGFPHISTLELGSAGFPNVVTTGDFTGDGELDLAVGLQSPNSVAIELNQGDGQFAAPDSVGLDPHNTPLVADFTGDGVPDVAIVDGAGDILFRAGLPDQPGSFEPPITINSGKPSRDIAAVVTRQGTLLASVDARDNAVTLFAYRNGQFTVVGSLPTGIEPALIVSADLNGNGEDDLVIRNAGDGTLTVYMSDGQGGFLPPIDLAVGPGISDVSAADVNQNGLLDLILANQTAGLVGVMLNRGVLGFSPPTIYRAGAGLSAEIGGDSTAPVSLVSQDGTAGVAAGALTAGGAPVIVALDSGSETVGVLQGLGDGRFANPLTQPTTGPTKAVQIADLTGNGNADLAVLGADGLTIWLGNGKGGFVQEGKPYPVGTDATGLTIADVNGDKIPDLVVGNAFGDVLVLLGEGNGLFQTPTITDRSVSLAVAYFNGDGTPTFIFANQARDRVVVQTSPQAKPTVLGDRTTGLLAPTAVVTADLNGDGIPDLIVPNSGGNNVLVYPGLPGGGFGPAMNDGNGFTVGTNPVAVIVAKLNGRPDLIVANEGSNDVSILLNEKEGNGFTFVEGPRLRAGAGPVALLYGDFSRNGTPGLLVSDSASKDVMLLPSLGDGFFNDVDPTVFPLAESPGQIFVGPFGVETGLDIVALNPGTGNVTLISGFFTDTPQSRIYSSGGLDPVAAFAVMGADGFDDLVVANNADGRVALLAGGPEGLSIDEVNSLELSNPTGLWPASIHNNELEVYAATEGVEAASLLMFSLGSASSSTSGSPGLTLLPLQESSLPLIATLLSPYINLNASEEESGGSQGLTAAVFALSNTLTISLGQGALGNTVEREQTEVAGEVASQNDARPPSASDRTETSTWTRVMMGLEEAFEEYRRETQPDPQANDRSGIDAEGQSLDPDPLQDQLDTVRRVRETDHSKIVDAAIDSWTERTHIAAAMPALEHDGLEGMAKVGLEPGPLTWMALFMLQGGLPRSSVRPIRARHGSCIIASR